MSHFCALVGYNWVRAGNLFLIMKSYNLKAVMKFQSKKSFSQEARQSFEDASEQYEIRLRDLLREPVW